MTLHDSSAGASYGGDWHIRWLRGRHGPRRSGCRLAGPGGRVRARYRRELAAIERGLLAETPALSSKFALFNHLTKGEQPVGAERLPGSAGPRLRPVHLAVLLALAALVTLCLTISAQSGSGIRQCQVTPAAGAAANTPVHGVTCGTYANTKH